MEKSYRIHTNITNDTVLNVNMEQDFDFIEVLTMKLRQMDAYKLHSSNYGVIIGRVLANDAFGIPNAKISLFIERDVNDTSEMEAMYPYTEINGKDRQGRRYNTLPDYSDDKCYRVVGTFPNKRFVLDDNVTLEVYDKYWKYTTVTNQAGDYMLFGVPTGSQQLHVDIDLSDIGILSQKPRDFEYKGYNITMFDNPNQFKESTNLDGLAQLFSQNKSTFVYPFWGDADNGIAAITRCDIQIQYKFEPTCVFMGSIVTDNEGHSIGHKCAPDVDNGMNNQLVAGQGTIEMIRKTTDGLVEEFQIQGNQLIDEDGVWCYQIPMNLDYVGTDEYGNIVPTDNPSKGIPTRTQVRFRISKTETGDEGFSRHTAKYLVPMNPTLDERKEIPTTLENGLAIEEMYNFGSNTPQSCFRDLYWNNVYSVKNYIPKVQVAHRAYSPNYGALKGSNLATDQNPIPFNKLRIDLPFMYIIVCILFTIVTYAVTMINGIISFLHFLIYEFCLPKLPIIGRICPFGVLGWVLGDLTCISLGGNLSSDNSAYYPGCWSSDALKKSSCPEDMNGSCNKRTSIGALMDDVQRNLALDFKIIKLDFYQDWLNGCLYMPLWYWRKRKKKTFFFGLFSRSAKNQFCSCDDTFSRLKTFVTCNVPYSNNSLLVTSGDAPEDKNRWHRNESIRVNFNRGLIKPYLNKDDLTIYYYSAIQVRGGSDGESDPELPMESYKNGFKMVRLYATDIILIGNLNENNLYGIPQFFKSLPSTTANLPAIATISEGNSDDDDVSDSISDNGNDEGVTITTGMDWGRNGGDDFPRYGSGLFMDLSCTAAVTKAKSCFNAERLSELGVNLDMSYKMQFSSGSDIKFGDIEPDGFITKLELDDNSNRAMFATMNHIGFLPQDYNDNLNIQCTTQVNDEKTNYLIPKFKYVYPTNFDGRMDVLMDRYKDGFMQPMVDEVDNEYLTFRLGSESGTPFNANSEERIRHFYYTKNGRYQMPLYNNSFYFYFGINKGSTAIDKFNNMFYSECVETKKSPFSIGIEKQGMSYCPNAYKDDKRLENAYPYIRVTLDDAIVPYKYALYDSRNNLVIEEYDMDVMEFVIGGSLQNGVVRSNDNGYIAYQIRDEHNNIVYLMDGTENVVLENSDYKLTITDSNNKTMSERISLRMEPINMTYEVFGLSTKFYTPEETPESYICDSSNVFYGRIVINGVSIDSHTCTIKQVVGGDVSSGLIVTLNESVDGTLKENNVKFTLNVQSGESVSVDECMCNNADVPTYTCEDGVLTFNVYRPNQYEITVGQVDECSENTSMDIVTVPNGENFNTYLNSMPLRFMIGSPQTFGVNNFYYTIAKTNVLEIGDGWFETYNPTMYKFEPLTISTSKFWADFIKLPSSVDTMEAQMKALEYELSTIFSLCNGVYLSSRNSGMLRYSHTGGGQVLTRSVVPYYSNTDKIGRFYQFSDMNSVSTLNYPNIVYENYSGITNNGNAVGVRFNEFIQNPTYQGNYFAAFTNNGGYINDRTTNDMYQALPYKASVNPGTNKKLGVKIDTTLDRVNLVHTSNGAFMPYLRSYFVDRRLSYELIIFSPAPDAEESETETDKKRDLYYMLLGGDVYGGIEMAFDENDNVIGDGLEYSYTINNTSYSLTFNNNQDKRLYELSFNGTPINYTPNSGYSKTNYSLRKHLLNEDGDGDILTFKNDGWYEFIATSCSYDMKPEINYDALAEGETTNLVECFTKEGESISFILSFAETISISGMDVGGLEESGLIPYTTLNYDGTWILYPVLKFTYASPPSSEMTIYTKIPVVVSEDELLSARTQPTIEQCANFIDDSGTSGIIDNYDGDRVRIISMPDGVGWNHQDRFFYRDGVKLDNSDEDFKKILFTVHFQSLRSGGDYYLMTRREHFDDESSMLTKTIKTYELSGKMHIETELDNCPTIELLWGLQSGKQVVKFKFGGISVTSAESSFVDGQRVSYTVNGTMSGDTYTTVWDESIGKASDDNWNHGDESYPRANLKITNGDGKTMFLIIGIEADGDGEGGHFRIREINV